LSAPVKAPLIRLAVTLDHIPSAFVVIEIDDDGTSTPYVGNYTVIMDDLRRKTQTKAKITGFPRRERIGVELIAEAFLALASVETKR
jgi:hypothetical protein